MNASISAAILAGGQSKRMGTDKSFVLLDGKPMIQHVIERIGVLELPTMLIANQPEKYALFGLPTYTDVIPNAGSLGGIFTALTHASTEYVLCVACDMPYLNPTLLRYLTQSSVGVDAVVPKTDQGMQGLHAVYSRKCLPIIQRQIVNNFLAIHDLFPKLRVRIVERDEISRIEPTFRSFINVNTPKDLAQHL